MAHFMFPFVIIIIITISDCRIHHRYNSIYAYTKSLIRDQPFDAVVSCLCLCVQALSRLMVGALGVPIGLLMASGDHWKSSRKALSPTFTGLKIRQV